jgi:hypothetical protein
MRNNESHEISGEEYYNAGKNPGPWACPMCPSYLYLLPCNLFVKASPALYILSSFFHFTGRACRFVTRQKASTHILIVTIYFYFLEIRLILIETLKGDLPKTANKFRLECV